MIISYAFTCGRLETIYKISNHLDFGNNNDVVSEQQIIEKFRADILTKKLPLEDTELFKHLKTSESTIVTNRINRALKENNGHPSDSRAGSEYKNGLWHELKEYKLSDRLVKAKERLNQKHKSKTGMDLTSRDIAEMTGFNSTTLRNMLAHKRDVVIGMLEKIEKFTDTY